VQTVTVKGQPVDKDRLYTIAACERDGDPPTTLCRITDVKDPQSMPYTLHAVLKEYLATHSPVTPLPEGNALALDAPATLLSQVTGVDYTFR
jgi:hypothetical protein